MEFLQTENAVVQTERPHLAKEILEENHDYANFVKMSNFKVFKFLNHKFKVRNSHSIIKMPTIYA